MKVSKGKGWVSVEQTMPKHKMLPPARERDVPTVENAQSFANLFDYFNKTLFVDVLGDDLPHPVLNFSRKRNSVAFFSPGSWRDAETGEHLDEISLVPEWTGRDAEEVCSSLVHEMAHYLDHLQGTACRNGRHGQAWFKLMDKLGLPGKDLSPNGTRLCVSHDILPKGAFARAFKKMPKDLFFTFKTAHPKDNPDGTVAKKQTMQGRRMRYQCPLCACERNGGGIMQGPTGMKLRCEIHDERLLALGIT